MFHKYNFVINDELNKKIKDYCLHNNISKNKLINYIIDLLMPVLDYYYFVCNESKKYKYKKISATNKIRIIINNNIYNKIKHIHNNMNTFSMATLIREMIMIFFREIKKNQISYLIKKVKRYKRRYTEKILILKKWKKNKFSTHMSNKLYYYVGYTIDYKVLEFNFST